MNNVNSALKTDGTGNNDSNCNNINGNSNNMNLSLDTGLHNIYKDFSAINLIGTYNSLDEIEDKSIAQKIEEYIYDRFNYYYATIKG